MAILRRFLPVPVLALMALGACDLSPPIDTEGGTPVDHVHGTRLVRFCCGGCKAGFKASPETFMADLDRALIEAQLKDYPLEKCVVSDEPLTAMGKPVDLLYGTRLVRLCCKGCKK